jgi:outer membrane receptor protein involved in Fe transport
VVACLFFFAAAVPAAAQETRGAIEGIVKDGTGGVLPGATITVKQNTTGISVTVVTDAAGSYRFPALAPGVYTVTATLTGFTSQTFEDLEVVVGRIKTVNVTMNIGGLAVSETVKAESPIVDVKQNAVTQTVSKDLIALLPNSNRDFQSVLNGLPGINYETDITGSRASGIMIDGASQSENRFVIDGQDTTNLRNGLSGKGLVVDFIEQIQVKQSGYNAEFRATTGGVVSVITKSGTNSYHGTAALDYNGKKLNWLLGDIRPSLRADPNVAGGNGAPQYFTTPRSSEYERETFEPIFDIGGPIIKNKAWFYLGANTPTFNQDRTVQWSNNVVNGVTYPAIQTFNQKTTDWRVLYNLTFALTSNLRVRVNGNNQRTTGGLALPNVSTGSCVDGVCSGNTFVVDSDGNTIGTSTSNPATFNPRATIYGVTQNDSYSATADWTVNNKTFASFTAGYLGAGSGNTGGDYYHGVRRGFANSNVGYLDVPPELQQQAGYFDNNPNSFTVMDDYNRFNVSGDVTRFANWRGQHSFKAGVQYERIGNDVNQGQQYPNVTLRWDSTRTTLDQKSVRGKYGYYEIVQQYTVGAIHSNNLGLFLQDQWSFNDKLTINYGVRFDTTRIPSYRDENPSIEFDWGSKVAPRLGFAYDVKGDGKWKAFGSWGMFYDIEKLEMPRGAWGADHWVTYYWTLDDYNWPAINCSGTPTSGCPGTYIEQNDLRHVSNDPNNNLVDPNMKPFKAQEFVVGLDHELTRLMSVGGRYVHKWVNNAIEDIGVQVVGVGEVFYIANPGYGLGAYPLTTSFPRTPFPQRDYDAVELSFNRRLANNWSLSANLTMSHLYGNYSGLSNSGSESNRNSPNVTRLWDGLFMSFTEKGCPDRVNCDAGLSNGLIPTDRPMNLKVQATYILPWGTSAGVTVQAFNGNLQTTSITYKGVPVMIYGQSDIGRTQTYSNTDLNLSQTFRLPKGIRATLQFQVLNLWDQDFETRKTTTISRDALVLPNDAGTLNAGPFFNGFNVTKEMDDRYNCRGAFATSSCVVGGTGRPNQLYNLVDQFRGPRSARFYIRFTF